jgi:hypothetical protein
LRSIASIKLQHAAEITRETFKRSAT